MNNKSIISIVIGVIVLSLGVSWHRISSKRADLQYDYLLSEPMADPSGMENAADKTSEIYEKADAFDAEPSDAILFIEKKISSLEPCRISAGDIILDIPMGAVNSEKDLSIRGLRDNELPELDYGLVNVTSTYGGYRCLPHGKFNKPLQLSIGYDTMLIPAGYRPDDVRTFFYDEEMSHWVCMPIDSIDYKHQLVVTSTDHFTDFINGILTQPEIPDASGYANTNIRGVEYANPLEGMTIMQAPTANNSGNCSMSYPIQIPAGRNGMAPQISISYNSDVKDGIMGPGWSLNIPNITVDTRWGVPPYSATVESESYLVNGEAIVEAEEDSDPNDPNTTIITRHKPLYVESGGDRGAEKKYAYLNEGKFDNIIRHGNSPQNYWWEVTDRSGVKYIYGDEEQSDQLQYSLAGNDPTNIAVWGVNKVIDLHGNSVKYSYNLGGITINETTIKYMRISEINYTSHEGSEDGPYSVIFEYNESPTVVQLSGIYGFLTADNKLLSKITIKYNEEFVKCYKFKYEEGVLSKKVLKSIAEITDLNKVDQDFEDTQEQGFYVHTFEYYDENEIAFGDRNELHVDFDDETVNVLGININSNYQEPSNISKNTSYSVAGGGSACVGFNDGELVLKNNTLGVNYHYTYDINNEKAQLIDLNGDGIVDRVEKTVLGDIKFYKGKWQNDEPGTFINFERPVDLPSLRKLAKSSSQTHTIGGELLAGYADATAMASYSYSTTKTINSNYFMDVNGDGFVDYVADDDVLLNFPDDNGVPYFYSMSRSLDMPETAEAKTSYDDCYSFTYGGQANSGEPEDDSKEIKKKREPVILWRSPMDFGFEYNFKVDGADNPNSSGHIGSTGILFYDADSIYVNGEYKDLPTGPTGWGKHYNVGKGGHVLFHVHPFNEKTSDIFNDFDIVINVDPESLPEDLFQLHSANQNATDANGNRLFHYKYSEEAVIQDGKPFVSAYNAGISWSATLKINHLMSDDLIYSVIHNNHEIRYCEITSNDYIYDDNENEYIYTISANGNLELSEGDQLYFRLYSRSNVDWDSISFISNINYEYIVEDSEDESREQEEVIDTTTYHPSLDMSMYSRQINISRPVRLLAGTYRVKPNRDLFNQLIHNNPEAKIFLTVKTLNKLETYSLLQNGLEELSFTLPEGSDGYDVYFDYTVNNADRDFTDTEGDYDYYANSKVDVRDNNNEPLPIFAGAGVYADYPDEKRIFGNLYRGWGQFSYKDTVSVNSEFGNDYPYAPIPFKDLHVESPIEPEGIQGQIQSLGSTLRGINPSDDNYAQNLENFMNEHINTSDIRAMLNPKFEPMHVDVVKGKWIDNSNSAFVNHSSIGSLNSNQTIMNRFYAVQNQNQNNGIAETGDVLPNFSSPFGSRRFPVINKVSKTTSNSFSASAGVSILNLCYNNTKTETFGLGDMMDMNGDGYPDIVKTRKIQYTLPNGDMSDNIFTFEGDDDVYTNHNKGELESSNTSVSFKPVTLKEKGTNTKSTEKNIKTTAGLGLNHNNTNSENNVLKNYIDVNSDGLPDIVTIIPVSNMIMVEYNLGYKFSSRFPLGRINNVSRNLSSSNSVVIPSFCFNKGNYSISGGVNANSNESRSMTTMMDINSDGLIDIVSVNNNRLSVNINNGNGFDSEINIYTRVGSLSKNNTFNISVNGSGSLGFAIMYIKLVGSLYADLSYSFSNEKQRFMDVNGDGAIDILEIRNRHISVKYGIPQKRNILKSVTTPAFSEYTMSYSMLYPDADNPNHKWILTSLKVSDNDGGFEDGCDDLHYQFEYSGMKYHRIERESYGFAEVTTKIVDQENNVLRKQKEYYITENGLRHGLKYRDEVLDDRDNLQTSTDYNWTLNDLNTGIVVEESECGSELEIYPRLESEQTTVYGRNPHNTLVSAKHYEYGKYGNITKYTNNYNPDEYVEAYMDYEPERNTTNLLDLMVAMSVRSADGHILCRAEREYNNYGDIVKVDKYLDEENFCTTDYEYDNYGNLTKVIYPVNESGYRASTEYGYDDMIHTYLSSVTEASDVTTQLTDYDYRFGKPRRVIAPNESSTVYTYYSDGKIKTIKSPMDVEYSLRFEYWDELDTQDPRWARVIHNDAINEGNTFVTQTVCDGLGRTMQTARKAVVNGEEKFVASGKNVYDDYGRVIKSYQPAEVSGNPNAGFLHASFENPTLYTYDCMNRVLTTITPDNKTIVKSYDISEDAWGDPAMLVTTTYPLDRVHKTYTDSRGLQTATKQASESDYITTTFKYSPMGELVSIKDPEGAVTKYEYDMLGRLVWRCHPDAGMTTFTYDNAGNLIAKATQKLRNSGREINYKYDQYNRLKTIIYPDNPEMDVYYEYGTSGMEKGLVSKRQDGVCVQSYFYNVMGDLEKNIRTFAFHSEPVTFKTEWEYDTWGRLKKIVYPDGETVRYGYDNSGKVTGMSDKVNNIKYDKYGKRTYIEYANGTNTKYVYNRHNQQLVSLTSIGADDAILQDIHYEYDDVYNITEINNTGDYPYNYTYEYDKLNRLVKSEGSSVIGDNRPSYRFLMSYSPTGRVLDYSLEGRKYEDEEMLSLNSASHYLYEDERHPHAVTKIGDVPSLVIKYSWDANGNIKRRKAPRRPGIREHYFNEENRLAAISDKLVDDSQINFNNTVSGPVATYLYDADGERVWKFYGMATATYRNGVLVNSDLELDKTFYPTQQITIDNNNLYKHYFIGDERISTEVTRWEAVGYIHNNPVHLIHGNGSSFIAGVREQVRRALDSVGYRGDIAYNQGNYNMPGSSQIYYYHYTHQGSVALVTSMTGRFQQHLQYLPYGGIFVDQRRSAVTRANEPDPSIPNVYSSFASPYTFSAKEKDSESGYNYFGARYYTDNIMMWLSVDPMSDERPWISPYNYCQWNPIGRVDTWGMLDSVFIHGGKAADYATEQLRQAAPNLGIQRDKESGKLSYSGTAITKAEKKIAQAIDDKNVMVNINAKNSETFVHKGEKVGHNDIGVGAFMGNELIKSENGTMIVNTYQQVNPERSAYYDKETGSNGLMGHELLESYFGGVISLKLNSPAYPARQGTVNKIYDRAHNMANRYFLGGIAPKMETKQVMCKDIALPYYRQEQVGWVKTK